MNDNIKKLTLAGLLIALGVACSTFSFPVGASRCSPVQHMVNVLAAVLLGPAYGVGMAFVTSLLRIAMATGTLLAFPVAKRIPQETFRKVLLVIIGVAGAVCLVRAFL